MNPFDWRGPVFLAGYLVLAVVVVTALAIWRRRLIVTPSGSAARLTDPYDIALLRGGVGEAVRVAVMSLLGRRLIERDGAEVFAVASPVAVTDDLERALLAAASAPGKAWHLVRDPLVLTAAKPRRERLAAAGFAISGLTASRLRHAAWLIGAGMLTVAMIKIGVAISRGHFNVLFLFVLAGVTVASMAGLARDPVSSARGRSALKELAALFREMRPTPGREVSEAVFLAAIYGLDGLHGGVRGLYRELFPRARKGSRSSCGSSCGTSSSGSSCNSSTSCSSSSSSGSSCSSSSSCGGGGCGGCGSS